VLIFHLALDGEWQLIWHICPMKTIGGVEFSDYKNQFAHRWRDLSSTILPEK